jgi:hypothetical protein
MQRNMIAHMVGGQNAEAVLALLDAPTLDRVTMEATIAIWEQIDHERESAPQAGHYQPGLDLPEPPPGQPRTKLYPGRLLPFTRLDPKFG